MYFPCSQPYQSHPPPEFLSLCVLESGVPPTLFFASRPQAVRSRCPYFRLLTLPFVELSRIQTESRPAIDLSYELVVIKSSLLENFWAKQIVTFGHSRPNPARRRRKEAKKPRDVGHQDRPRSAKFKDRAFFANTPRVSTSAISPCQTTRRLLSIAVYTMSEALGIDEHDLKAQNPRFLLRQPRALQWFEHGRLVKRHDEERQAGQHTFRECSRTRGRAICEF